MMFAPCFPLFIPFFISSFCSSWPCHFSACHLALCRRDVSTHSAVWAYLGLKLCTFFHPHILPTFLSLSHPSPSQHPKPVPDLRAHKSCTRTWWGSQDSLSILISPLSLSVPGYYSSSCPLVLLTSILDSFIHSFFIPFRPLFVFFWHPWYACSGSACLMFAQAPPK